MTSIGAVGGALTNDYYVAGYSVQGIETIWQGASILTTTAGDIGPFNINIANSGYGNVAIIAYISIAPTSTVPGFDSVAAAYFYNFSVTLGTLTYTGALPTAIAIYSTETAAGKIDAPPEGTNGVGNTPASFIIPYTGLAIGVLLSYKVSILTTTQNPGGTLVP